MTNIIDFSLAYFTQSVFRLSDLPPDIGVEVAFIGRSNVGKSSVINVLCQQHKLARTSSTPGRTQCLNFFSLSDDAERLVDLPGYGYAKVPLDMKAHWKKLISGYLSSRRSLRGVVIIMDIRHPMRENDKEMINQARQAGLPCYILLNKADKLSYGSAKTTLLATQKTLRPLGCEVQLFSAHNKQGLDELIIHLSNWMNVS